MVPTFKSVDKILTCDHSNGSYRAVLSCGAVYYAVQGCLNYKSVNEILISVTTQMKAVKHYFPESVDEMLTSCKV